MKKKVVLSLVLLTIFGASLVFAQAPTLDKLTFTLTNQNKEASVKQVNKDISGAIVIPDTYNGVPVTTIASSAFQSNRNVTSVTILGNNLRTIGNYAISATGITSITIPASVESISQSFGNYSNSSGFTSVTFMGSSTNFTANSFSPGGADLLAKYQAGGAGTYTRRPGENIWAKQGGSAAAPAVTPQPSPQAAQSTDGMISFERFSSGTRVSAANKSISGDLVIPSTHDGRNVMYVAAGGFEDCTRLTSVTFPATIAGNGVGASAFVGCTNLTRVTFRGNSNNILNQQAFEGDLYAKLRANGPGTYTRDRGGRVWTKID